MREPNWILGVSVYECVSTSSNVLAGWGKGSCMGKKLGNYYIKVTKWYRSNTFTSFPFIFTKKSFINVSCLCSRDLCYPFHCCPIIFAKVMCESDFQYYFYTFIQTQRMYNTKSQPWGKLATWMVLISQCRFILGKK